MNSDPHEAAAMLVPRLRRLQEEVEPRREELRAQGYPVDELLVEADDFLAALQGLRPYPADFRGFLARLSELVDEVTTTRHLQDHAEAIASVLALPEALDDLSAQVEELRAHSGRMEDQSARELEAAVAAARDRLERGEVPAEELQDIQLTLGAQEAEFRRRIRKRTAALMLYWEMQTPEWWAHRTPEEQQSMRALLAQWAEQRETLLSELPLADRQELEAMTLDDFNRRPPREI